ncbi:MAG: 50S ribosomal protein L11 methyltransferase [Flavobacteriales bacterium]|nr:50S ribosomal protein L11 methyltransferase [Flavobacteriales bacterium]
MNYMEVICQVAPREPWADLLIDELASMGFESFEETELGFNAYVAGNELGFDLQRHLKEIDDERFTFSYEIREVGGKNWNEEWEKNFHPIWVEQKLLIRAPFHSASPDGEELVIMPRMSFGTGHHASTWLMLAEMMTEDFTNQEGLDMGCGTGILGIYASKKGAKSVLAVDNYPDAVSNAKDNILENRVTGVIAEVGDIDRLENTHFDFILANINRNVLLEHMPVYATCLRENRSLFTSGFLVKDLLEIYHRALSFGLQLRAIREKQNWVMARFEKRPV